MEQGRYHANTQQAYGLPQRPNILQPPQDGWHRSNGNPMTYKNPMTTGYVHSGYQAAIQGTSHHGLNPPQNDRPSMVPITAATSNNTAYMRKSPRYGPGGPVRCSHLDCPYSGYPKDVEIHRMDRHLIFPPGYKHKKGPPDGETGPNRAIPGTGIVLNTPEAITTWIEERKKRWPTAARVAEQHKRKAEAIERGELEHVRTKRPRPDIDPSLNARSRGRGRVYQRGRGRGRGRGTATRVVSAPMQEEKSIITKPTNSNLPVEPVQLVSDESSDDDSGSGSDIDPEKDVVSSKVAPLEDLIDTITGDESSEPEAIVDAIKAPKRRPAKQPAKRPYNPLVDKPSFLRKLLQPEIRHTVSNLSQAVRFIVDNDFFRGVELKAGEAERHLITELDSEVVASAVDIADHQHK